MSEIKLSLLELHDKMNNVTFMLDSFMKEIKGMMVEEVEVEEEVYEKEEDGGRRGRSGERRGGGEERERRKRRLLPLLFP